VRTYKPDVRKRVLPAIDPVAKGEALVSCAPKEPLVKVTRAANARYNDPELMRRLVAHCAVFWGRQMSLKSNQ